MKISSRQKEIFLKNVADGWSIPLSAKKAGFEWVKTRKYLTEDEEIMMAVELYNFKHKSIVGKHVKDVLKKYYINVYESGQHGPFKSRLEADKCAFKNRIDCIEIRVN